MKYCIIGGDARIREVARLLEADGDAVCAIGHGDALPRAENAQDADIVLLGLPTSRDHKTIYAPFGDETISYDTLLGLLNRKARVFCGMPDAALAARFRTAGILFTDYFEREELAVLNAIPTAEGALALAMEKLPIAMHHANCLVLGFGRIGKYLAHILKGMGAHVTVSARRASDMTWIEAYGYHATDTKNAKEVADKADVIFNTIPSLVIDAAFLDRVRPSVPIIDLASMPGGVDTAYAEKSGKTVLSAQSLPGKVAPKTAGEAIFRTIKNILQEDFHESTPCAQKRRE